MRKYIFRFTALMSLVFAMTTMAQDQCSLHFNGQQTIVYNIVAKPNGDMKIQIKKNGGWRIVEKKNIKKGSIVYPKSRTARDFSSLKKAIRAKKSSSIISISKSLTDKYKDLGWGGYPAYIQGNQLLKAGKTTEAKAVFSGMRKYDAKEYRKEGYYGEAKCMVKNNELNSDSKILMDLIASSGKYAGFAFNEKGKLYKSKGQMKEAAREFMKAVMLTDPKTGAAIIAEARKNAYETLVKMKDNRANDFK